MKGQAEKLAKQGRYGDSMLVHMTPAEVDVLRKTSPIGDLTINPETGQPEAFIAALAPFIPAMPPKSPLKRPGPPRPEKMYS